MNKIQIYIGIDPDIDKNGIGIVYRQERKCEVLTLRFCELMDFFSYAYAPTDPVLVIVEAGWLNKSVWHMRGIGIKRAASVGLAVGRNHQTGILIADMLEHMGYKVIRKKPLSKCWHGHDGKITHEEIQYFTHIEQKTNQENRDALLLAWVEAGLPVRVKLDK